MMATATSTSLPRSIRQGLRRLERRIRWLGLARGLGLLAIVLAVGAVGGMALDFAWALPGWVRWGVWLVWVTTGLVVLVRRVIGPLLKRWSRAELAALAEAGQEGLAGRLVSAVELLGAGSEGHGSPELIGALVEEAEERVRGLDLARVVEGRGAGWWLGGGMLAIAVVVGSMAIWPDPLAALGQRFCMPWSRVERVDRLVIAVEPGDVVAAAGSDVAFRAMVRPRFGAGWMPETAWLEWSDEQGRAQRAMMTAEPVESSAGRAFAYTLKGLPGTIDYRVVSGSANSRTQRVQAAEPPAVKRIAARVEPPSYLKIPEFEASDPNRLNVWEGSRVTLSIEANQPLERALVQWPAASGDGGRASSLVELEPAEQGKLWSATLTAETSGTFAFSLQGRDGLVSRPEMPRRLRVVADQPPTLVLGGTEAPLESKPDDVLLIDVKASDDVAVASATLHYAITRAEPKPSSDSEVAEIGQVASPLEGFGTREVVGQAALVLKGLRLNSGDEVAYFVEVADNRPLPQGPNRTRSESRRLRIAERAQPLLEQQGTAERAEIREKLERLRRKVITNQQVTAQLRQNADSALQDNSQWAKEQAEALSDVESEARKVIEGLAKLARDFRGSDRFAPLAQSVRQIMEIEAEGVRDALEQAGQADEPVQRLADLRQADARQLVLKDRVEALVHQFDERARQEDDRRRLGLLAERQEELAHRIEELAREGGSADTIERAHEEQEALRREVDELTRRSPELRDEVLTQQLQRAETLADRVGKLAGSQREEARRSLETPERAEALANLARRQQAIESDARRLAMEVGAALRENGRGALDTEALARPIESLLRGDVEQARHRIEGAENLLRRFGRDLAEVRRDPKALAQRLIQRQRMIQAQTDSAIRAARTPEAQAALPKALRDLAGSQSAIAELTEAFPVSELLQDQALRAQVATAQAAETLREGVIEALPSRLSEARKALESLADALPDLTQERKQVRQRLNQVRHELDQNGRELVRHLQETAPKTDPAASAHELAERIEPLLARQEEIAEKLIRFDAGPESRIQRDRAGRRAQALADALRAFREVVPEESGEGESGSREVVADWHLVGPFAKNMPPPFDVAGPINLKRVHQDKTNRAAVWKAFRVEDGLIDLNKVYPSAGSDVSAYGFAEIESPDDGPGRLMIGSDDTLLVWLNGQKVYDFQETRSYNPKQDEVAVAFIEGVNRLVIRCGNSDGDWKFSLAATLPATGEQAQRLALVEQFRRHLPLLQNDALAATDRLREALDDRQPADELASELAEELEALEARMSDRERQAAEAEEPEGRAPTPTAAEEVRRIATALRMLDVPDAPASQAEAVRLVDRAVRLLERQALALESEVDNSARAVSEAVRAAKTLADRLAGSQTFGEQAEALAQALRTQSEPDAPRDSGTVARVQAALADDLARLTPSSTQTRQQAEIAMADALALASRKSRSTQVEALADAQRDAAEAVEALAQELQARHSSVGPSNLVEGGVGDNSVPMRLPDDPELVIQPEHADAARALARRERQLRQALQALLSDRAGPQEALRDEAEALGRDLAQLRDETRPLSPRSQGPASQASQLLQDQGATAMTRAIDQLAQGRPDAARAPQRQAADHVERAARAANDLVSALRDDLSDEARQADSNANSDDQMSSGGLAQARRLQEQAANQLADALASESSASERSKPSAEAASTSMREAAQGLRSAASPGPRSRERLVSDPSQAMPDPQGNPGGPSPLPLGAIPSELTADSFANRNWGELPGYLRDEILQASQSRYRDDYARLIQLYFREIAGGSDPMAPEP